MPFIKELAEEIMTLLAFSKDSGDMESIDEKWHTQVSYSQIDDERVTQDTKFLMHQYCTDHHYITNDTRHWKEKSNMIWYGRILIIY